MEYVMAEINGNGDLASRDRVPSAKKKGGERKGKGKWILIRIVDKAT